MSAIRGKAIGKGYFLDKCLVFSFTCTKFAGESIRSDMKPCGLVKALCGLLLLTRPADAQILTYQLLPGSTITPSGGPTGALTGSFQWQPALLAGFNEVIFEPVSLQLSSASCSLSLYNGTQLNSAAALDSNVFGFAINVQATGLSISTGTIIEYPNDGTYAGSSYAPTEIYLPDLRITPIGGGLYAASLGFTAELVPEPSSSMLLAVAFLPMFIQTIRRQCKDAHSIRNLIVQDHCAAI